MDLICYYYGVWVGDESGHGLCSQDGRTVINNESPWTIKELDTNWLHDEIGGQRQPEGIATLIHEIGWTALAFWDRSGDDRFKSRSVFVAQGTMTFAKIMVLFSKQFPEIVARPTFIIQLWNKALKQPNLIEEPELVK